MTLKASTALRNKLLDTNPFKTIFASCLLKIYDGPVPATADDALDAANHLLVTISDNDTGTTLSWESAAVSGAISKSTSQTWRGVSITSGTASFYRLVLLSGDTGSYSTTVPRLQGSIATSGADLNMTSTTINSSTSYPIDAFSVSLPTL